MKKFIPALFVIYFLCINSTQAQFTLYGEVNARTEFRNGFKKPIVESLDPALFTEQRTRLYANYKAEDYEVQIALHDIRMWGADGIVDKTYGGSFGVAEAWARYYMSKNLSV